MDNSGIRSKIASFEAHNEEVRATTIRAPRTTTATASSSRRQRIQREAQESPARMSKKEPSAGSLAERRRARQLQKQKRLLRGESPSSHSPMTMRDSSRASSQQAYNLSSRKKPLPEASPKSRQEQHFANVSMTSSTQSYDDNNMDDIPLSPDRRLSPAKAAKAHRMQHSRRKNYHQPQETAPPSHDYHDHSEPPTDDEVTLTSVRQIMQPEGLVLSASSSTIETDALKDSNVPPTNTQAFLSARAALGDDDKTFDYGERDDDEGDDDVSVTFEQRKEAARRAKEAEKTRKAGFVDDAVNPLLNPEDVNYYRQTLDTPAAKITGGLVLAGTAGCLLLGPVGLLVGAAAVGIGVGVMQIPEEQRAHVKDKAVKTVHQAKESAVNASEVLSSSCAAGCHDLGVDEHLPANVKEFFENPDPNKKGPKDDASVANGGTKGVERSLDTNGPASGPGAEGRKPPKLMNQSPSKTGKRRAACLRNSRIVPVDQIYSLEPSLQPRAWLDVMASANTSQEQKNEGMEEILILAKDKRHARFFLEEGILDSVMYIITQYLDNDDDVERMDNDEAFAHAKLAASCCVTLGKAHCAAVHTEGDLQLMSLYERGTVPEERQLAQMLHEVPHHVQVALSPNEDVFVAKQVPMAQAEELARSIKALADGQRLENMNGMPP